MAFLIISSCSAYKKDTLNDIKEIECSSIYWENCMRYKEPYSDDEIVVRTLGKRKMLNFEGPIYVQSNCNETIISKKNQKPMNGTYKIVSINETWNEYSPYSIIATFKNGKKDGKWEYYRNEDFYTANNIEVIKALSSNKNYKPTSTPIKIERYENGLPNGEWWQKSENSIQYFIYKDGKLIDEKTKFISGRSR